jgi:AraC-like DNA-binding protein
MHEKVDALWTVETLAVACGMSRSGFASRFKELVGETPLEYLTSWRMQKAAALLQKGDRKLIDVARSVGYDSDAAFSRAFKRVVSVTPRDSRQRSQGRYERRSKNRPQHAAGAGCCGGVKVVRRILVS